MVFYYVIKKKNVQYKNVLLNYLQKYNYMNHDMLI